jgi:hypothetical protein
MTDFEPLPVEAPPSPDSKELADYESYTHRELPRLVRRNIEELVRRDSGAVEASLIRYLVSIIHDFQEQVFQSYFEMTDRDQDDGALGNMSIDPLQSPLMGEDMGSEHHHSALLTAAFQSPPPQYMGQLCAALRSSPQSSGSLSPPLTTPGDMVFSGSAITSVVTGLFLGRQGAGDE